MSWSLFSRRVAPVAAGARTDNGVAVVRTDYRNPDPIARQQIRSIEMLYGAGQAGRLGNIRWGERASSASSFKGDLGPLQRYRGAQGVSTSATIRPGFNRGLPSTSTVPGAPAGEMLSLLINSQAMSNLANRVGGA